MTTTNLEPEGCLLVAHDTGDGWALAVETADGDLVAYLKWPDAWPETLTTQELIAKGFMIV